MENFQDSSTGSASRRNGGRGENPQEPGRDSLLNSFALVTYISDPLARFLDDLRRDLAPDCLPRAHVTILPPRCLESPVAEAWEHIRREMQDQPAFECEAVDVGTFESTCVVYLEIGAGRRELERMHTLLNAGPLAFCEPYEYHPHVTLAQHLAPGEAPATLETARQRWAEYRGPRRFGVDTLTFVQNTADNRWLDLAELKLGMVPSIR